ncbi:lycopene beta-cyclase CrtY [Noviherbaspirillum aridicola]|uniref:Lycopene beta-cyclase n=1 Tax=Noviherbaspirillum aridicola TaxID=2849687 RepID=A0ABQ4Q6R3_9BURK|nr:lycopene beta-cyclase CrtY [Noviherbaspirillum aridicola]GIZ52721.1 hypothetical protein NCCP691_27350 [Noviherbaspirillum aridicola]
MHDLILVGGGLANGLIALRLKMLRPSLRLLILEREAAPGGNHTWSFYRRDLSPGQLDWLRPLVAHSWPGYEVRFPGHHRRLDTGCHSISSARFQEVLRDMLGASIVCGADVQDLTATGVRANGKLLQAKAVLDGRGHAASHHMRYAWQKFLGREVMLEAPHGQALPCIMDATVAQEDGYRFVYTLPLGPDRMLIEDTYYSNGPALDAVRARAGIDAYAAARGWKIAAVTREESGILPITLSGDIDAFWREPARQLPCSGLRAGLFHATTGYSLPCAVRLADRVARLDTFTPPALRALIHDFSVEQWRAQAFMRLLNRMLFFAGSPAQRFRVLQRFYTLPQGLIERFYAGRLTRFDEFRILAGKPPVPVLPALRAAVWTGGQA